MYEDSPFRYVCILARTERIPVKRSAKPEVNKTRHSLDRSCIPGRHLVHRQGRNRCYRRWHRTTARSQYKASGLDQDYLTFGCTVRQHKSYTVSSATHHDHDVKLLWPRDELHRGVVDDHAVELDTSVAVLLLGDSLARVQEQTVTEFHDVGLVDTGDFLRNG